MVNKISRLLLITTLLVTSICGFPTNTNTHTNEYQEHGNEKEDENSRKIIGQR